MSAVTCFTYRADGGRVFEDVGLWDDEQVAVTGLDEPEQLDALFVSDGLFPLLRVQARTGRLFTKEDDSPGTPRHVRRVAITIALVAIAASLIPALRAARLDPADALRQP